jgi:hypothetical protein
LQLSTAAASHVRQHCPRTLQPGRRRSPSGLRTAQVNACSAFASAALTHEYVRALPKNALRGCARQHSTATLRIVEITVTSPRCHVEIRLRSSRDNQLALGVLQHTGTGQGRDAKRTGARAHAAARAPRALFAVIAIIIARAGRFWQGTGRLNRVRALSFVSAPAFAA